MNSELCLGASGVNILAKPAAGELQSAVGQSDTFYRASLNSCRPLSEWTPLLMSGPMGKKRDVSVTPVQGDIRDCTPNLPVLADWRTFLPGLLFVAVSSSERGFRLVSSSRREEACLSPGMIGMLFFSRLAPNPLHTDRTHEKRKNATSQ
jgi:hypothetical protein